VRLMMNRYIKAVIGKEEANTRTDRSLYQRANGYNYNAVKIFMPAGAKKPVYAPYVEHIPPDPSSAIFWLKNRDPEHWRDAWQLEHTLGKYHISEKPMTEEEWIKARAIDVTPKEEADVTLPVTRKKDDV
jgi:hypothetical protein